MLWIVAGITVTVILLFVLYKLFKPLPPPGPKPSDLVPKITYTPTPASTNTPTPVPPETPTPAPTNTPTPIPPNTPAVTPENLSVSSSDANKTPGGIPVESQEAVYITDFNLMLREDASYDAEVAYVVPAGTRLTSTGICENGWIRIEYHGKNVYVSEEHITLK